MSKKEKLVDEIEFTEEETKNQMLMFEGDFIKGLLAAADYKRDDSERKKIQIVRNGQTYFEFTIRPLSEDEYDKCKTKHTKYVRNKQLGIKLPEQTNSVKYRAELIYQATIDEDREKLWDNKQVWTALGAKGMDIVTGTEVIDIALKSGEKDAVLEALDVLSGYDSNLEEVAKN